MFGYLGIQIVGAPDHEGVAGEVPIAVTEKPVDADTAALIRQTIVQHMGPAFAPDEVLFLGDLGLQDYPRAAIGQVQKYKLAQFVTAYRMSRLLSPPEKDSAASLGDAATAGVSSTLDTVGVVV